LTNAAALESSDAQVSGDVRIAGRYTVLAQIGSGGMGAVYRVNDEAHARVVALKQLKVQPDDRNARMLKALFEREFHTLSRLKHPRIIEVYDYGVTDEGPYYTMELLAGKDLQVLAPLPYREACRLLRDVASSLALIHAHRLVHRDVSPRNVRLTVDGRAKLIDFGALANFGPANEVIGTPMCIAPETLHRQPLDQRTDLFALGAVAYWALTGRAAYSARTIQELPSVWPYAPPPPSGLQADIPPALDALVLSLLNTEPLARPASAAAVIDQLTLIAQLEPEEDNAQAAESYLQSGQMVGRDTEREWMKRRMLRALEGKGTEVIIEGPSGIGKSRLLRELGVVAQLEAIVPLHADAQATSNAYGVAIALGIQLLNVCPEIARAAAEPHAALLGHLSPELRDKLGVVTLISIAEEPNERRARYQTALHEWFMDVARKLPLFVAVDNLQATDDDSAAFLAGIGRESRNSRMILAVTQRSGDPVVAAAPVRALRKRGGHLKLAGLSSTACEELVKSLFGDVANSGRMAKLLHERSAGNPGQCMDVARLLVRKQIARYVAGTWLLPLEVSTQELPIRMEEVLAARLGALSTPARELAEALCLHVRPVSLERCLALGNATGQQDTYAALHELVSEQIVLVEEEHYRFEQTSLREAMLALMDVSRRRALHLQAANTLLASGDTPEFRVEAAWHLLHAGDETRGADILAETGRDYIRKQSGHDSLEQVVRALATAVDVYERQGRSEYEIAGLMSTLLPAAFFVDRNIALKYGERAIDLGRKNTGLGLAQKLSRFLGKKLGLIVGLIVASVRFARQKKRGLKQTLPEAIAAFISIVPSTVGTFNICYDIAAVKRISEALEPLRLFGDDHIGSIMHDNALGMLGMGQGREADARVVMLRNREQFGSKKISDLLGHASWSAMYGGILFSVGILQAYEWGTRTLESAAEMDALGVRLWGMAADQLRMLHHALRGETDQVQQYRERVELFAVQGGTTWQAEMFWPVLLLGAEAMSKDTLSMRRLWEQLARRAKEVPTLEVYSDAAQAAYLGMRGEHAAAIALYERVLPQLAPRERVAWSSIRAHAAEVMIAAGQPERAKQLLLEVLTHAKPADYAMVGRFLEPQRQLALAEAALGNLPGAMRMLDELLAKYGAEDQPLLVGLLHKSRAEVAMLMKDVAAFDKHASEAEQRFRSTKNPALITQWERLVQQAVRRGLKALNETISVADAAQDATVMATQQRIVSELAAATDPCDFALRLVVQESRAGGGFLYLYRHKGMQLASATSGDEPPKAFEQDLLQRAQRAEFEALENTGIGPSVVSQADAPIPEHSAVQSSSVRAVSTSNESVQPMAAEKSDADSSLAASAKQAVAADDAADDEPATQFVASEPPEIQASAFQVFVLSTRDKGRSVVVGGVIVKPNAAGVPLRIDPGVLTSIARILYERQSSTVM
jgi:tRNA A-37 threonylcarbamoyl transferase component Bud32